MSGNGSRPRRSKVCVIPTDGECHRGGLPDEVDLLPHPALAEG